QGSTNGSASVTPIGGTPAYLYSWSNGQTTSSIISLSAGTYVVSVSDNCGATSSCSYLVSEPASSSFSCYITNELQISPTVYQFDIYLLNRSTSPFEYAGGQWGITVNSAIANGGTLTPSIVAGS